MTRILGIDPGFDRVGFGVVNDQKGKLSWVYHGCLQTKKGTDFSLRLQQVHRATKQVIEAYQPDVACIEKLFFQKNVTTAIEVGMARGVILLALVDAGVPIVELTPNQIKQGLTGHGGAKKDQVQEMVRRLLKLKDIPKPDDAADALAMAIVGGSSYQQSLLRS